MVSRSRFCGRKSSPAWSRARCWCMSPPENELHLYHHDTNLAYRRLDQVATTPPRNRVPRGRVTRRDRLMQKRGAVAMLTSLATIESLPPFLFREALLCESIAERGAADP
jgi:hypothetical protein